MILGWGFVDLGSGLVCPTGSRLNVVLVIYFQGLHTSKYYSYPFGKKEKKTKSPFVLFVVCSVHVPKVANALSSPLSLKEQFLHFCLALHLHVLSIGFIASACVSC